MKNILFNLDGNNRAKTASYAYVPIIGWMLPLLARKDNSFCQHHGRQGFILASFFVLCALTLNITNILMFTLQEWEDSRIIVIISIYAIYLIYPLICIINAALTIKGKKFNFPLVKYIARYIEI